MKLDPVDAVFILACVAIVLLWQWHENRDAERDQYLGRRPPERY